jgi:hypothetical protein
VSIDGLGHPSGSVVRQQVGLPGATAFPGWTDVGVRDNGVPEERPQVIVAIYHDYWYSSMHKLSWVTLSVNLYGVLNFFTVYYQTTNRFMMRYP